MLTSSLQIRPGSRFFLTKMLNDQEIHRGEEIIRELIQENVLGQSCRTVRFLRVMLLGLVRQEQSSGLGWILPYLLYLRTCEW